MGVRAAVRPVLTTAAGATGLATAAGAAYLLTLAAAAFAHRDDATAPRIHRLAVLVPAHDEEVLVGRCIESLLRQDYPAALREIVVVADNCSDRTASIARDLGATVLERHDPSAPGKGRALRWAMDRLLVERPALDAIVVVDADSVADPGLLAGLEAHLARGAEAVQGEYLVLADADGRSELRAAAFRLFHGARFAGRAALGMPCFLVGNGMLFSCALLERQPWSAFTSAEDLEYTADLRLAGVRPVFAAAARLSAPAATVGRAGGTQRMRWEGGRFHVVRTRLPRLVAAGLRSRRLDPLDAALDLAVPPLGLLVLITGGGLAAAEVATVTGLAAPWTRVPFLVTLATIPVYVLVGLRAADAPPAAYRALLQSPVFMAAKLRTYARMVVGGLQADTWERTERPDAMPPAPMSTGPTTSASTSHDVAPSVDAAPMSGVGTAAPAVATT